MSYECRYDEAREHLTTGLELAQARDQRPIALEILAALAQVGELRGVPGQALVHLQAQLALRDSIFDQAAVQRIAAMEAQTEADRQEYVLRPPSRGPGPPPPVLACR